MVSHEVRSPVTQILGIVHILQENNNLDAQSTELISNLKTAAADLDVFTRNLTTFMHKLRPESGNNSDLDSADTKKSI